MARSQPHDDSYSTSTGHMASSAPWLDIHFEASRPEYERALDMVDIQPGWRVLDAGCGSGSFLPLLAERVGPTGSLDAVDLAPENVEIARARMSATPTPCPVEIQAASLFHLPFPDDTFDGLWIANVLMYMTPEEWDRVLAECRRVVRPGGVVAAKEADSRLWNFWPIPYSYLAPLKASLWPDVFAGWLDTRRLPFAFERAGLQVTRKETVTIERWAPLDPVNREFLIRIFTNYKANVEQSIVPDEIRAFWQAQTDPDAPEALINDPEFACVSGHLVVVGRVPD